MNKSAREHQPFAFLERSRTFGKDEFVPARDTHNPGSGVAFRVLAIGVVKGREATTGAHL